jgi:simple sugar transport system substrate-binding protein
MRLKHSVVYGIFLYSLFAYQSVFASTQIEKSESLRFVFITCAVDAKFFGPVKKGMNDAAQMMDVQCEFIGTEGVDLQEQVQMVHQAIEDGYDGIALNIIDPEAFDDVVEQAIEKNVPVVAFNIDDFSSPNSRLSTVSQNFFKAGKSLVSYLYPSIPQKSHVLLTLHDEGVSALDERLRGEQDALRQKDARWTVIVTGNDSKKGAETIHKTLRENPDIRIILGTGQSDTEAAGIAIEKYYKGKNFWSAGFDLSPTTLQFINDGLIRCTIDQQPYMQGFYPVIQLTLFKRYGIEPSDIDAGATIIDQTNVDTVIELTQKGYR